MDVSVILTYRCNSKCSMCYVWQNPTHPDYEVSLETLKKLPDGIDYLNLTGGEPTLRKDLPEIVDLLRPKAETLEISTNGLLSAPLERIVKKHPDIKIRISVEGIGENSNKIRGEQDGFEKKLETMRRLIDLGGCDLGFAMTIQDENVDQLVEVYRLSRQYGVELATSALHNAFQFHKIDNGPYDRLSVARKTEPLITEMLKSWSVKNWFRAYLNLGLIAKILGQPRLMPCTAGTDFSFVDPWSDVYACNVRPNLKMGNLEKQDWDSIWNSREAEQCRQIVKSCKQNCWMVASAKTAMRMKHFSRLPKFKPLIWVLVNKLRVSFGRPVPFDRYLNYNEVYKDEAPPKRPSFLGKTVEKTIRKVETDPYQRYTGGQNR